MKVLADLIFHRWEDAGRNISRTEQGVELSMGDLHSGTCFEIEVDLGEENKEMLLQALELGYVGVFRLHLLEDETGPLDGSACQERR